MLSPTDMCGKRPICWITYPIRRRSSVSSSERTLRPSIVMSPSSKSIRRLTIFMAVVLPAPDGPTSTQMSPAGTASERFETAADVRPG